MTIGFEIEAGKSCFFLVQSQYTTDQIPYFINTITYITARLVFSNVPTIKPCTYTSLTDDDNAACC